MIYSMMIPLSYIPGISLDTGSVIMISLYNINYYVLPVLLFYHADK
jgi:hypothetical protein